MKHVVILGGGFAGIATGIKIKENLKGLNTTLTIVDQNTFHLFTPSLYEVATSEQPKKNIAIPLHEIFDKGVNIVKSRAEKIDCENQTVNLSDHEPIRYDYLIIALGSRPAFYNIPNLEKYSIPFKSIQDGLRIKEQIYEKYIKNGNGKITRIIIGGGGFAGTELACEILNYRAELSNKHKLNPLNLELKIIQGSDRVLNEMKKKVSDTAAKRLAMPAVNFAFGGHIREVAKERLFTDDGKEHNYDILIWTGGVAPSIVEADGKIPLDKRGQIAVNSRLQVDGYFNIFAIGDIAGFKDPDTGKSVPNIAQVAEEQGVVAGLNVIALLKGYRLKKYTYRHFGYVVPLRGKFSIADLSYGMYFEGFAGWCMQQLVLFRYLFGILPVNKALKRWNNFEKELM